MLTNLGEHMYTIVAGGRTFNDYKLMIATLESLDFPVTRIVSGTAKGADQMGEKLAASHGIPVDKFPANWDLHGKSAGYKRNAEMAKHSDALVAFWDGESRGTKHMIDLAKARGLKVVVVKYKLKQITVKYEVANDLLI